MSVLVLLTQYMKITLLGTGTSTGVPEIGCQCPVCTSPNKKDTRWRTSALIETNHTRILIDVTPDFRMQMLPLPFKPIHGVLLTHEHYDHVGGIDDLRPFGRFGAIDIYAEQNVSDALMSRIPYCFATNPYRGVPNINLQVIDTTPFYIDGVKITPIRVMHHRLPILGYRIGNFAYLTDVKTIPSRELYKLTHLDVLVVSALRKTEHISHQTLDEALALIQQIKPKEAYLTHLGHQMGLHDKVQKELPKGVFVGYDGMELCSGDQ